MKTFNVLTISAFQNVATDNYFISGLSNLNQPRASHLSVRSYGRPHEAKLGEIYKFSNEFWL